MEIQGYEGFSLTDGFGRTLVATASLPPQSKISPIEAAKSPPLAPEALDRLAETLGKELASTGVTFDIHDESGHIVARVIDRESGEVLRQVPEEAFLEMARRSARLSGQLLDTRA